MASLTTIKGHLFKVDENFFWGFVAWVRGIRVSFHVGHYTLDSRVE